MFLDDYQAELRASLKRAGELLGAPALPLWIEWSLERSLGGMLRWEGRTGFGDEPAMMFVDRSRRGHRLMVGVERFCWDECSGGPVHLARVVVPGGDELLNDFWAVRTDDYRRFYRSLRRVVVRSSGIPRRSPRRGSSSDCGTTAWGCFAAARSWPCATEWCLGAECFCRASRATGKPWRAGGWQRSAGVMAWSGRM